MDLFSLGGLLSITDHVKFSREMFFYPSGNRSLIYARLFENSNARILRVLSDVLRWGNKPAELKCSINTAFWSLLGCRCRTDLSFVLALTCLDLQLKVATYRETKPDKIFVPITFQEPNSKREPGNEVGAAFSYRADNYKLFSTI